MRSMIFACIILSCLGVLAEDPVPLKRAFVDGTGFGWRALTADDFTKVNSADDTWAWKEGVLHCTGRPVSVMRTKREFTNFELVLIVIS